MNAEDDNSAILVAVIFAVVLIWLCGCAPAGVDYSKRDCSPATSTAADPDWWKAKPRTNSPARWSELSEVTPTNTPVCADGFQKK